MLTTKQLLPILRKTFPPLHSQLHKGQNGRIAVIGGSYQFSGAPYYAAVSALKAGADLAHIFCSISASSSIKSYSPQIIVHPVFVSEFQKDYTEQQLKKAHQEWLSKILAWKSAIHSWVIGPGLGRDRYMSSFFPFLIKNLPEGCLVVFDADALYFLGQNPQLIPQLKRFKVILTPNARQLTYLRKLVEIQIDSILKNSNSNEQLQQISPCPKLQDFTLFVKGEHDLILGKNKSFIVRTSGGNKRCGGLGDILSGVISVSRFWSEDYGLPLASRIVRLATGVAYELQGRGLTAPSVIKELPKVVMNMENASL